MRPKCPLRKVKQFPGKGGQYRKAVGFDSAIGTNCFFCALWLEINQKTFNFIKLNDKRAANAPFAAAASAQNLCSINLP
jgi:hypothetical protein